MVFPEQLKVIVESTVPPLKAWILFTVLGVTKVKVPEVTVAETRPRLLVVNPFQGATISQGPAVQLITPAGLSPDKAVTGKLLKSMVNDPDGAGVGVGATVGTGVGVAFGSGVGVG